MNSTVLEEEIITRGVANIIPSSEGLAKALSGGRKLKVYFGIDPTATHIHLGHAVLLRKLQKLSDLGHEVTFLVGDFTALIGDTSDKDTERPILTSKQIEENFATYKKQAEKVLDFKKVKLVHNSAWLKKLTFEEIVKLCQHFSAGDFVGRELIKKRLSGGQKVGLHELLYPVMQGYDSYHLDTDLQLGGTDQTFNMAAGRTLQKDLRGKESFVLASEFLMGTDGRKMSKSWGNAIWLDDQPDEIYGKVMSLKDDLLVPYFKLATNFPLSEVEDINRRLINGSLPPLEAKKNLAFQIVTELWGKETAVKAQAEFERVFQNRQLPSEIEEINLGDQPILMMAALVKSGLASSNSEAKRMITQGAVSLNEASFTDSNGHFKPETGQVIRVGRRRFVKVK